ncbi:MAG: hypothetical protein M1817_005500 [Caeruleum heppii]|nr:MAG: hypothetical protein M1817_005500 [Caeruleum heppii]
MFARKDTLRRHTEDGCSKRFEISSKASRMTEDLGYGDETVPVQTSAGVVPMRRRFLNGDIPFSPTSAPCGMQGSSSTELRSLAQAGIAGKGITGTHNSLGFQA